jgi:heme/copper-type cytochrome/quinol oxidase subunit 2
MDIALLVLSVLGIGVIVVTISMLLALFVVYLNNSFTDLNDDEDRQQ